jgi:hypothetical protein
VDFARLNGSSSVHSANALLLRCIVPKIGYMLEMLPPHLVAGAAEAAHALVMSTYCTINDISAEEAAAAFDRMVLPPSLLGCGLRYYPDISPAAFITSRLHTAYAVSTAIADAESAQAAAAAESAADTDSSSSDGAPALARRSAAAPRDPPAHTATSTPSTTPLEDVTAEITAALDLLPAAARVMIDPSDIGSTELDEYKHLQRKMTRCIEEKRAIQVLEAAKSAVSAAVRNSETFRHAQRNLAHLNACDGDWVLAPALAHMRMPGQFFRVRIRRYLNMHLPICNYAGGVGSSRPPLNANVGVNKDHDLRGDFLLSVFNAPGQAQWTDLHEEIKNFFYKTAKQAGITSVSKEKRADLCTTNHRPGDIKIGSTRHGWKAAAGKTLLIDFTTISSVCAKWVTQAATTIGGGASAKAANKTQKVLARGELSEHQFFQAVAFEADGYKSDEAKHLLHAWAKQHGEDRGLTKAEVNLLLFKWTSELAFIRAKYLAKCIVERAKFCAEQQDNNDGIKIDVRPPMPHQLHAFIAH